MKQTVLRRALRDAGHQIFITLCLVGALSGCADVEEDPTAEDEQESVEQGELEATQQALTTHRITAGSSLTIPGAQIYLIWDQTGTRLAFNIATYQTLSVPYVLRFGCKSNYYPPYTRTIKGTAKTYGSAPGFGYIAKCPSGFTKAFASVEVTVP